MATRTQKAPVAAPSSDLLRDLIIIQLAVAGVGQREIRSIVGGDSNRISKIAGPITKALAKKT